MSKQRKIIRKGLSRRRTVLLGVLGLLIAITVVAAACGDDDTPTPVPPAPTATARPGDTPVPTVAIPTSTPRPATPIPTLTPAEATAAALAAAGLRPISEWTCDEPGTQAEVEAALDGHRGETFIFASWGGSYQDNQRKAFLSPFEEQFGISIVEDTAVNYGKMRAIAETGNLLFHISAGSGLQSIGFGLQGVTEPLDCAIVDISGWPDHFKEFFYGGGGAISWSRSILYSTDTFPPGTEPTSIVDFFDVENFPGRRGIWTPGGWKGTLRNILAAEMLADDPGRNLTDEEKTELATLDPAEIDHAFELLEDFAPNISAFLSGGQDCMQLLASGELDMCNMDTAQALEALQEGLPIDFCKTCPHISFTDQMFIMKGVSDDPELFELTQLFLAWTSFPERHAQFAKYYAYGPVNLDSIPFLDDPAYDETKPFLPTSPELFPWAIFTNEASDGVLASDLNSKWEEFLLTHGGTGG